MSTLVTVFVCDNKKRGLSGYKVKQYGDDSIIKTDSEGKASLLIDSSECAIYVNGSQVYKGYTYNAPDPIVYIAS